MKSLLKYNCGHKHFQEPRSSQNETLGPAEQKILMSFRLKLHTRGLGTRLKTEGFKYSVILFHLK